jgi:hypothetical protein
MTERPAGSRTDVGPPGSQTPQQGLTVDVDACDSQIALHLEQAGQRLGDKIILVSKGNVYLHCTSGRMA